MRPLPSGAFGWRNRVISLVPFLFKSEFSGWLTITSSPRGITMLVSPAYLAAYPGIDPSAIGQRNKVDVVRDMLRQEQVELRAVVHVVNCRLAVGSPQLD